MGLRDDVKWIFREMRVCSGPPKKPHPLNDSLRTVRGCGESEVSRNPFRCRSDRGVSLRYSGAIAEGQSRSPLPNVPKSNLTTGSGQDRKLDRTFHLLVRSHGERFPADQICFLNHNDGCEPTTSNCRRSRMRYVGFTLNVPEVKSNRPPPDGKGRRAPSEGGDRLELLPTRRLQRPY
jgi:hypothetical protein